MREGREGRGTQRKEKTDRYMRGKMGTGRDAVPVVQIRCMEYGGL